MSKEAPARIESVPAALDSHSGSSSSNSTKPRPNQGAAEDGEQKRDKELRKVRSEAHT
jgi:hypothetical protein